jgi:uncharacterized protein involved in response to NO
MTRETEVTLPVLLLGFRPFYLLAAIFAVVALPVWLGIYFGVVPSGGYLSGAVWHSHEMVFGFAVAVIAGFLLTAVRNWTGLPTPDGNALAALALLWILGRVFVFAGPPLLAAIVDFAFLPALAVAITIPIARSRNGRNFKILGVLAGLALANLGFHLAQSGMLPASVGRLAPIVALDIITILVAIVAGRVIPVFTANAVATARPRKVYAVDLVAIGSLLLLLLLEVSSYWLQISNTIWAGIFFVAGAAHFIRLILWDPFRTHHNALLWMLPVAYAWMPIALIIRGLAMLPGGTSTTAAFHALTIGAIASLMVAMMTRSALGHTGRPLEAGWVEIGSFMLLQTAAIVRIVPGIVWPQHYPAFLTGSAILWSLAFVVFVFGYWTILTRPRIDEEQ